MQKYFTEISSYDLEATSGLYYVGVRWPITPNTKEGAYQLQVATICGGTGIDSE